MSPRFTRVAIAGRMSFHCVYATHLYPFPCWRTLRVLPVSAAVWTAASHHVCVPTHCRTLPHAFSSWEEHLRLSCPQKESNLWPLLSPPLLCPHAPRALLPASSVGSPLMPVTPAPAQASSVQASGLRSLSQAPAPPGLSQPLQLASCFPPWGPSLLCACSSCGGQPVLCLPSGLASSWDLLPSFLPNPPICRQPPELPFRTMTAL